MVSSLRQSVLEARVSEVRDTPVITITQQPYVPPKPDSRRLLMRAMIGMVSGGAVTALLVFGLVSVMANPELDGREGDRLWRVARGLGLTPAGG